MAVSVTLTVSPTAPTVGQVVTATYAVSGNDGTPSGPPVAAEVSGDAVLDGQTIHVSTVLTLPGTPAVPPVSESFTAPVVNGRTFTATSDPKVWKLTV